MTMVKCVTVALENKPGQLAEVARALAKESINIEAIESDTVGEVGFVRIFTNNAAKAEKLLRNRGLPLYLVDTLEVRLPNRPGELARLCEALAKEHVNIEGLFGSAPTGPSGEGRLIMRVSDVEAATRVLKAVGTATTVVR